jgi:hypothetical protein
MIGKPSCPVRREAARKRTRLQTGTPPRGRPNPPVQTNPRLDQTPPARPTSSRPVDLAHHHRLHPTTARPRPDHRSAPPLGTPTRQTRPADPRPGPARVSPPPRETTPTRRRAETLPARPRTPTRIPQQAAHHPPTHRQNPTPQPDSHPETLKKRLKHKFKEDEASQSRPTPPAGGRDLLPAHPSVKGRHPSVNGGHPGVPKGHLGVPETTPACRKAIPPAEKPPPKGHPGVRGAAGRPASAGRQGCAPQCSARSRRELRRATTHGRTTSRI